MTIKTAMPGSRRSGIAVERALRFAPDAALHAGLDAARVRSAG